MSQVRSHSCKASRSACNRLESCGDVIRLYRTQSSAKRRVMELLTQSGRSLIKARNSNGPRTLP